MKQDDEEVLKYLTLIFARICQKRGRRDRFLIFLKNVAIMKDDGTVF